MPTMLRGHPKEMTSSSECHPTEREALHSLKDFVFTIFLVPYFPPTDDLDHRWQKLLCFGPVFTLVFLFNTKGQRAKTQLSAGQHTLASGSKGVLKRHRASKVAAASRLLISTKISHPL